MATASLLCSGRASAPAGEIIDQNPDPETTRKSDLVINVTLSLGEHMEEMPRLVDQERNAAEALLNSLKNTTDLEFEVVWAEPVYHDTIQAGRVVSTDPAAGDPIHDGDTVTVVTSKGREPKPVMVIPFVGMSREEAQVEAFYVNTHQKGE